MSPGFQRIIDEFYPAGPKPPRRRVYKLKLDPRSTAIRLAMRRLRDRRRQQRLNNRGQPLLPVNAKYMNKKWKRKYAKGTK